MSKKISKNIKIHTILLKERHHILGHLHCHFQWKWASVVTFLFKTALYSVHYTQIWRFKKPICFHFFMHPKSTLLNEQSLLIRLLTHTHTHTHTMFFNISCGEIKHVYLFSQEAVRPLLTPNEECSTNPLGTSLLKSPNKRVNPLLIWRAGESARLRNTPV